MDNEQDPPEIAWLTLNELSARWKVSKRTIRRIDVDKLPCFFMNRMRRYKLRDVTNYENSKTAGHLTDPETEKDN